MREGPLNETIDQVTHESRLAGQLADIALAVNAGIQKRFADKSSGPLYSEKADYALAFLPLLRVEMIKVKIAFARKKSGRILTDLIKELTVELAEATRGLPPEYRL